jgi:hypothetical protein
VIVGGSAIEVTLGSDAYVSQDVDLVGDRRLLAEILRRWGFTEIAGRSRRIYWHKRSIGLVDLVGSVARSALPARTIATPFGPVRVSALEPLVVRRLVRSKRERSAALYHQAVQLARVGPLDWDYLKAEARYEQVEELLDRLRKRVRPKPTVARVRRSRAGSGTRG